MNSRKPEYGHRRQYGDRSTRQWDDYDDGWKERRGNESDVPRDSYHKYGGEAHSSTDRTGGNREYSDSPKSMYSKDSSNRDWSRRSPVRRHSLACVTPDKDIDLDREYAKLREENQEFLQRKRELGVAHKKAAESKSLPEWSVSEKKRRRHTEDDDFRYRQEPEDTRYRKSPDNFTHRHPPKDFKHRQPPQEDFKYRKMPKDSKHREQHEDFAYKRPSGYYKDRHFEERNNDHSQERTRSQEFPTRSQAKPRDRNDSPSPDYEDRRHTRTRPSMNESRGQVFDADHNDTNQSAALAERLAEQKTAAKGFQRFLNVLNKGVDVAMLTKIVGQSSKVADDPPQSPASLPNAADHLWSPSCARQQESRQNSHYWSESEGSQREAAPPQDHRPVSSKGIKSCLRSPKERSVSDEKSLSDEKAVGSSHFSSSSRSRSPPVVEKTEVRPEDEHKRRQMQDVLQAIGMDLGFEELGQMSNRIQERLYGKKDSDGGHGHKERRETETKRALSPERHSRSSSSGRSSFGTLTQQFSLKQDSYEALRNITEVPQTVEYSYTNDKSSSSSLQDSDKGGDESQESVAFPLFSPNPAYTVSEAPPTPAMPTYSAAQYSPYTYPAAPALPPNWLVPVRPMPFLPHLPGYLPYPRVPTLNAFQLASAQSNAFLQQASNRQLTYLNMQNSNPVQPLNVTQKSKTLSRPRCLQVIDTEQPGQTKPDETKHLKENVEELKKYCLSLESVQKYSQSEQNTAFRVLLLNHRLKNEQHNTHNVHLNDTSDKPDPDGVKTLQALQSEEIGPEKKERKPTIKLRLLEHKVTDKPPGGV
ncbi:zinc finger CCCH domain-containing protein 13-like [Centroberyx affinis]|uniref:zinc finger CCCH domain-containing protein 13-like n=1 Tax=Centroberyx affinis TaxID=166261 RepID=UPI003A5BB2C2